LATHQAAKRSGNAIGTPGNAGFNMRIKGLITHARGPAAAFDMARSIEIHPYSTEKTSEKE